MPIDTSKIVQALVGAQLTSKDGRACPPRSSVVVTVSRDYYSHGDEIARQLAERLDVPYFDREILDAIIEAAPQNKAAMERLDQQVSTTRQEVMQAIVTGTSPTAEYRRHLVNVVLSIARQCGVIVGRGAHLLLANHHVLRVRIVSSPDVCAMRLAKHEDIPLPEAKHRIKHANQEHADFIRKLFNEEIDDPTKFDLVLNTDHIDVAAAVQTLLLAIKETGFSIHDNTLTPG